MNREKHFGGIFFILSAVALILVFVQWLSLQNLSFTPVTENDDSSFISSSCLEKKEPPQTVVDIDSPDLTLFSFHSVGFPVAVIYPALVLFEDGPNTSPRSPPFAS